MDSGMMSISPVNLSRVGLPRLYRMGKLLASGESRVSDCKIVFFHDVYERYSDAANFNFGFCATAQQFCLCSSTWFFPFFLISV